MKTKSNELEDVNYKMFIFGRCILKLDFVYVSLLVSILRTSSSSHCLEGKQYYDSDRKQCLPCKICKSPTVVVATCQIYSNTKCGVPSFMGGPFFKVLQDVPHKKRKKLKPHPHHHKNNYNSSVVNISLTNFENKLSTGLQENCTLIQKNKRHKIKRLCKLSRRKIQKNNSRDYKELPSISESKDNLTFYPSDKAQVAETLKPKEEGFVEENIIVETDTSENMKKDIYNKGMFLYSFFGKVIVSAAVILINLLLIVILIFKVIKTCYKRKSKDENCHYMYNQKMPHPSQKPIKCRFTAVLPTKTPEYANVDSYLNSLISPNVCSTSSSSNWDASCNSAPLPQPLEEDVEARENSIHSTLTSERDPAGREPLISSASEVVENANMIQLYSRIPSPNPFTMDRLLEHRRAIGSTSVENNLYVETWCSSPSPRMSRSRESSVTPSPALSCVRKPFSNSTSSSPLTTRTFRATPAFTSFHPSRV